MDKFRTNNVVQSDVRPEKESRKSIDKVYLLCSGSARGGM